MKHRGVVVCALVLASGAARGDGAWLREVRDERGRVVAVVPRQSTTIAMRRETVAIVPHGRGDEVLLFVNVRYAFQNPASPTELLLGFPELDGRTLQHNCQYECDDDRVLARHATIETFAADASGHALAVTTLPGSDDYARWFAFTVPFASGETLVRNLYVAHPGSTTSASNTSRELEYRAEYILHTGSQWAGAIGEGDVWLNDGGPRRLRHFTELRPTRADDVQSTLSVTVEPSPGRPLFIWDYGNGRQYESVAPRVEMTSVAQQSSARPDSGVAHLGAMALDGDPTTAWIDAGASGAVGEWLQIPTHRLGRLRGLLARAGETSLGIARIRRLRMTCFDLEGNELRPTEIESAGIDLADVPGEQRVVFPRPMGACHAVRLTVEALHGSQADHAGLAEVAFIE